MASRPLTCCNRISVVLVAYRHLPACRRIREFDHDALGVVHGHVRLPRRVVRPTLLRMFIVTEADAAAIRAAFEQDGELSAAIELRRRFPLISDNATAREHARIIAGWGPLPDVLKRGKRRRSEAGQD